MYDDYSDDGDLALLPDLLDASFGDGPEGLPTPAERLAAGRAALHRRRRTAVVATSAAVVVVVGAGAALAGAVGGRPGAEEPKVPLASSGSLEPSRSSTSGDIDVKALEHSLDRLAREARRRAELVSNLFPASLDIDGLVVVKDGWRITQRVEEPMGYQPPEASLGVVVTNGQQTRWMLLSLDHMQDGDGNQLDAVSPSASADDAGKGYSRFEDWLASMVELQGGEATAPLVTVGQDDSVVAGPGSTLVDVQEIDVIEGYTSPGDRVAEVRRDGHTWFAVIRGHGADAEVIPVDGDVLPHATLAALLLYVSQQAESGAGVR